MRGYRCLARTSSLGVILALWLSSAWAQRYEPIDLGTLGGNISQANGISPAGIVVGEARIADGNMHPFWSDGLLMHDLGTLGGLTGQATAMNGSGWIVGGSGIGNAASHAFLWRGGALEDLGTLGGATSFATGINSSGWVAGRAARPAGDRHAFLWRGGTMEDLGVLPAGHESFATDVNDSGVVVGFGDAPGRKWRGTTLRAFRWQEQKGMHDLGTLGGAGSYAYAINNDGWIVGDSDVASGEAFHAFLFDGKKMRDLGTIEQGPFLYSTAYDVNDLGQIVGYSDMNDGSSHAFISSGGDALVDLNTLLTTTTGWEINYAYGINNNGWIAARGRTPSSPGFSSRAILLRPVP